MDSNLIQPVVTIIDAGGRYGIHDTWRKFTGDMEYHLFEPDPEEASRLKRKYKNRAQEVHVHNWALLAKRGETKIHIFKHKGLSSRFKPNEKAYWFSGQREAEKELMREIDVRGTSVDEFCAARGLQLDFLKIDTEGSEYEILKGSKLQLAKNVLGLRIEAQFDQTYKGASSFSQIHDFMLQNDFILMNMDYIGRGVHLNNFVDVHSRFGVLANTDITYVRNRNTLFDLITRKTPKRNSSAIVEVLKCASFCLLNYASDVALDILLKGIEEFGSYTESRGIRLFNYLRLEVARLFNRIKYQPNQNYADLNTIYKRIFCEELLHLHEFYENEEINPD